jgi:hypothetical protein
MFRVSKEVKANGVRFTFAVKTITRADMNIVLRMPRSQCYSNSLGAEMYSFFFHDNFFTDKETFKNVIEWLLEVVGKPFTIAGDTKPELLLDLFSKSSKDWCTSNTPYNDVQLFIKDKEKAMLFKLTWGGNA